jgi:nucleotide-binding universal stress UspA family protein
MTYSAVITQVQCDADASGRLACAVDMAGRFDAALIGVGAEMIQPIAYDTGLSGVGAGWIVEVRESIEARLKLARGAFFDAAKPLGSRTVWISELQMPATALSAASRAADLVVAGGGRREDQYSSAPIGELVLSCGRPVLVAPAGGGQLSAKTILVAWKDTREARRALSDALPFFLKADHVEVVELCAKADAEDARCHVDDVAAALRRRGVKASAMVLVEPHPTGQHLLAQARRTGADLIVSGAYGHSRLGEWVFGGITQDLLSQDALHLLLSH